MRFLTYVKIVVIMDAFLALAFGALFYSVAPTLLGVWIAIVIVLVIPFTALHLWLLTRRLDDYGGRFPFPGLLGLLGVDLEDDDYDSSSDDSLGDSAGSGPGIEDQDQFDAYGNPITFRHHCAYCHAPVTNPDAKFCDECGKPVASSPPLASRRSPEA